jgi:peptidoglycan/LPS O-acetylase OafA/YrhL
MKTYVKDWWRYLTDQSAYPGLDLLRATAIILVIFWHFSTAKFPFGWIGVDLFFILSGFLIGMILLKGIERKNFHYGRYMLNRVLRIYPLYIVVVGAFTVFAASRSYFPSVTSGFESFFSQATFSQTILPLFLDHPIPYYLVTWSLVVEMVFYILIPLIAIPLQRYNALWLGLLVVIVGYIPLRFWWSSSFPANDIDLQLAMFQRPYYRLDELFYGVVVALAVWSGVKQSQRVALILGTLIALGGAVYIALIPGQDTAPSMALLTRDGVFLPSVLAVGFALITYGVYSKPWAPLWVRAIARLAFPLYLVHALVLPFSRNIVVYLFATLLIAVVASFTIEYPFIRIYKGPAKKL